MNIIENLLENTGNDVDEVAILEEVLSMLEDIVSASEMDDIEFEINEALNTKEAIEIAYDLACDFDLPLTHLFNSN
jgi:hypothetical protein